MSEKKIKETVYINFKSKKDEKKEKITEWLQSQDSVTNSILSLIEHAIDRFGNADIMDHDISRKLYMERLFFDENDKAYSLFPTQEDTQVINQKVPVMEEKRSIEKISQEKIENGKESVSNDPKKEKVDFSGLDADAF